MMNEAKKCSEEECLHHASLGTDTLPCFIFGPTLSIFWEPIYVDAFLKGVVQSIPFYMYDTCCVDL